MASVVALSAVVLLVFVGCPSGDNGDDGGSNGNGDGNGGSTTLPKPNAFTVTATEGTLMSISVASGTLTTVASTVVSWTNPSNATGVELALPSGAALSPQVNSAAGGKIALPSVP